MNAQTIHRSTHTANFTILPNQIWQSGLSVAATAALGYILSRPPTWKIRITDLRNKLRLGRDKVYRTLQELCAAGYARMTRLQRGVRWEFFDVPQIFETSDTTEPTPDSRLPEIKLTEGREALERTYTSSLVRTENTTTAEPLPEAPVTDEPSVVVSSSIEDIKPVTTPTTLPEVIVEQIERLPVTPKEKKIAAKTLSNLTLDECKMILAVYAAALVKGGICNKIGYLVVLVKRAKDGSLSPVTTTHQETIAQRLAREEKARQEEAKRGRMDNATWAKQMIDKLGMEEAMRIMPWYVPQ